MPTPEFTTESQLISDIIDHFTGSLPTGLPAGFPFVNFRRIETLPIPAAIVGHEGFERAKMKGMEGTGTVAFRIAIRTDMDSTNPDIHRELAAAIDRALLGMETQPGPLDLTYLHAILREAPQETIEDRRQITVLRYQVVCTRCEPAPEPAPDPEPEP
jgi:hypothetical protein